jgi:cobalamin biosynthesis protein CobT
LKANVIANLLKRKNRDYQFSLKSMRTGRLDTNKLAEAKQMVPNIYERMGSVKTDKLCVSILVDESGSMSGSGETAAREAAIFLNEAMKGVPDVELFIYGHTADYYESDLGAGGSNRTQLLVYKEPGVNNDIALGGISARSENRDGVAMMAAAKRVRARTSNHGVFIIISDGSPSAIAYRGEAARTHVRRMANEIEKMGFQVVQVTIGGYRSKDMFKNVVDMDDISTFPTMFVSFLKKKINSLIKEKVIL